MDITLKSLQEQVIVITGASSGIGLATARMAAQRGASVVLTSRNEAALQSLAQEMKEDGRRVTWMAADVSDRAALERVAAHAEETFGSIDTWVNNAGVSIYGELAQVPVEDARRLFDTNYWGVVNGSLVAVERMRGRGGAIINLGSVVSDVAIPLQGHYSASKHAVKGFTDVLRMELEHAGEPIAVTLVKPTSIDTPYPMHARNYMDSEPAFPPPVYAPDVVARTILTCAENPTRDILVGGGARMMSTMGLAPRLKDRYMEATMFDQQQGDESSPTGRRDSLYEPAVGKAYGQARGNHDGHVMKSSLYTRAALNPLATAFGTLAVVTALRALRR